MLSGEKSSGEMLVGLNGLLGLRLGWDGLKKPKPMRKYSRGISMASGCSSVTIEPHAWTCKNSEMVQWESALNIYAPCKNSYKRVWFSPRLRQWIFYLALKSYEELRSGKESSLLQKSRIDIAVSLSRRWCLAACQAEHIIRFLTLVWISKSVSFSCDRIMVRENTR